MKIKYWDETSAKFLVKSEDQNGRKIETAYFFNCELTGLSKYYPNILLYSHFSKELILPTIEKFMSLNRGTVYEEHMEYDFQSQSPNGILENPVFYFAYNVANYYHFIYDTIPYLYTYFEEKKKHKDLKLLIGATGEGNDELYPFVVECLDLLGISKNDIIIADPNVIYKKIIIGSSLTHNRMSDAAPRKEAISILSNMIGNKNDTMPERIYISRRTWKHNNFRNIGTDYTKTRMCINEDDVVKYFVNHGFVEVFCENLNMKDKIELFSSAKIVAGPIGGGMCNVLFSKPETTVISINSPLFFDINKRFKFSMEHTNLYHFNETKFCENTFVEPDIKDQNALSISGGLNSPWEVDMDKLKRFMRGVI